MNAITRILATLVIGLGVARATPPQTPDEIYGNLFTAIQEEAVFLDSKTFVDCIPRRSPVDIVADYTRLVGSDGFDLSEFVSANFLVPGDDVFRHINRLWKQLERKADVPVEGSSLLPLPHPYIVPGGRFREVYYWDSYFTMLGLKQSGENAMIENMIRNFDFLIETQGFIPNGNRSYYLSRSQPPFFSLMIDLLAEIKGDQVYGTWLRSLKNEYAYWMDEAAKTQHVVKMPDGSVLNRYYDQLAIPRQESYREDVETRKKSDQDPAVIYRNLRSAAESGWDFSSRWFADGKSMETIRTTDLVPVDLNCLLYHLEQTIAKGCRVTGDPDAEVFEAKAAARKKAINQYCWSDDAGWYVDFDLTTDKPGTELTLAGVSPLFFGLAPEARAAKVADLIEQRFLAPGGVVTTLKNTGQQWDAPNGWAPLQWLTIQGLENYGHRELARKIARRWIKLNIKIYQDTGKMMEKYDVMDLSRPSGGGEYPSQDGFGWTNGVLLKLIDVYGLPEGE